MEHVRDEHSAPAATAGTRTTTVDANSNILPRVTVISIPCAIRAPRIVSIQCASEWKRIGEYADGDGATITVAVHVRSLYA